ncbi:hypothetical protein H5410_003894 [Solanum commersonii]|uniref:Uncharacterized protein n=1 Tax=Solanum commersonii TaxID=4109 RepID=A0A9J6B683_SOLCO|nr:hypothetical protein H5410_003894 [Solanum commersonii]
MMPSLQTALPQELANNAIGVVKSSSRGSKDERLPSYLMTCLFGLWYLVLGESTISDIPSCLLWSSLCNFSLFSKKKDKQHNTELLVGMVRQQFKMQMHEIDPDKFRN